MPIPNDWHNPITAAAGQVQVGIEPARLLASRGDLIRTRLDGQRQLLPSGIRRFSPVRVTPDGVIIDGHRIARVAAEVGKLIEVQVVSISQRPAGELILDLPVR